MVNRLDKERLCLCPPIKLLMNNLLNSSNGPIMFGGILLNHTHAGPLRMVGKALHIISSRTPWRCIVVLKVAIWSHESRVPSYESKEGILNLGGKGWLLMEAMKGEFVRRTNHLRDSPFSCSQSFRLWPSLFEPFPMAPFVKRYPLTGFWAQHSLIL